MSGGPAYQLENNMFINIGLKRSAAMTRDTSEVTPKEVRAALLAAGFIILRTAIHTSDTELTLVAQVLRTDAAAGNTQRTLNNVAVALDQDCIAAWYSETGGGALVGPRAAEWGGAFNPEYFLLLDGKRLAEPSMTA